MIKTTCNPMFPGKGWCDPHLRVFGDTAWLYLTHDKAPDSPHFIMEEWQILSSKDLVVWKDEGVITPAQTWLPDDFKSCWAVDAAQVDGKTYFYFSECDRSTGVLVGDTPAGPWHDPLGKPLVTAADLPEGNHNPYDPGVFIEDDGTPYLIVGVWDFYLIPLNRDMISFDQKPVELKINNPQGPYPDRPGETDDKPFLFKREGKYYLTWGCFYAISDTLFGPYDCKGSIIQDEFTDVALRYPHNDIEHDRHASFFEWKGQWHMIVNDMSQTRTVFFRDCSLARIHFRDNGEIEPVKLTVEGIWG